MKTHLGFSSEKFTVMLRRNPNAVKKKKKVSQDCSLTCLVLLTLSHSLSSLSLSISCLFFILLPCYFFILPRCLPNSPFLSFLLISPFVFFVLPPPFFLFLSSSLILCFPFLIFFLPSAGSSCPLPFLLCFPFLSFFPPPASLFWLEHHPSPKTFLHFPCFMEKWR